MKKRISQEAAKEISDLVNRIEAAEVLLRRARIEDREAMDRGLPVEESLGYIRTERANCAIRLFKEFGIRHALLDLSDL